MLCSVLCILEKLVKYEGIDLYLLTLRELKRVGA